MTVKSRPLGPGSLKIGETGSPQEWAGQLTKAALTPSTDTEDAINVLSGETLDGDDTTTYTLDGTILQDYDLDSLELYCFDNKGTDQPFVFTPSNAGEVEWSGTVRIRPVVIGGDVKKRNTSDFSFPVQGDPTHGEITAG
jgi:hypothetical protein